MVFVVGLIVDLLDSIGGIGGQNYELAPYVVASRRVEYQNDRVSLVTRR
jgi:hypothetical protein